MKLQGGNDMRASSKAIPGLVAVFLLLSIPLALSHADEKESPPATYGMVYDYDNRPVADVAIYIDNTIATKTDINGRCVISGIKDGEHYVLGKKNGYEDVRMVFTFGDAGRILYIKMISCNQLLELAESEMEQRHWGETNALVARIMALQPQNPSGRYLEAVLKFRTGDPRGAQTILLSLLQDMYRDPYVFLFLADLEQYKLGELGNAKIHLSEYLRLRYDPDIELRLQNLCQKIEANMSDQQKNLATFFSEETN